MIHTIDAQGKKIGRVATQAAALLLGKASVDFSKNKVADVKVHITNASKAEITAKKKSDKEYVTFTGFRGGLDTEKLSDLIARKGYSEAFTRAVHGMIPNNKLKKKIILNLTVSE
ncbi:MAG: uL13 family ribosomal protein [Candidatus Taylorbacteria bacterium]|nr:uL13 family ribosomal protein [Candidatus Taylorbacteria bacterium]